jgi:hypothetical protein
MQGVELLMGIAALNPSYESIRELQTIKGAG